MANDVRPLCCDICAKKINPLKDEHHSIPSDEWMIIMCADCYKKFLDDLKRMEEYVE